MERIAKVIARAGICSRRDAEKLIAKSLVKVNGELITSPATKVVASDIIEVAGEKITAPESTRLWLFHKPKGCLTTSKDPEGRPTIYDYLPENLPRVITIGRLDFNTEGLLLLTNDGELARHYELPVNEIPRTYKCRIYGRFTADIQQKIEAGVIVEGVKYNPAKIAEVNKKGSHTWLEITITEGKNREIRKIFEHFNLSVNRLIRTSYGDHKLNNLASGQVLEVKV